MMARFMLLDPWYEKVRASYELEFRTEVEKMYNRFSVEGLTDDVLKVPIQGKMGRENIRAIASKLWELAYKMREKGITIENP
jgi:pyruvate/2-oxoglutarate dehydrogenase complex dihydrolipoamide acyltransferase (E2) component